MREIQKYYRIKSKARTTFKRSQRIEQITYKIWSYLPWLIMSYCPSKWNKKKNMDEESRSKRRKKNSAKSERQSKWGISHCKKVEWKLLKCNWNQIDTDRLRSFRLFFFCFVYSVHSLCRSQARVHDSFFLSLASILFKTSIPRSHVNESYILVSVKKICIKTRQTDKKHLIVNAFTEKRQ